jgi:hypothetical protein
MPDEVAMRVRMLRGMQCAQMLLREGGQQLPLCNSNHCYIPHGPGDCYATCTADRDMLHDAHNVTWLGTMRVPLCSAAQVIMPTDRNRLPAKQPCFCVWLLCRPGGA